MNDIDGIVTDDRNVSKSKFIINEMLLNILKEDELV